MHVPLELRSYQKPSPVELTVVPAMWGEQIVTKGSTGNALFALIRVNCY